MNPKFNNFWINFGPILGSSWAPKLLQNRPQNGTLFWSPRDPLLGPYQGWPKMPQNQGLGGFLLFLAPLNDH